MKKQYLSVLLPSLLAGACSLDRLGVTAVEIDLAAVPLATSPAAMEHANFSFATGHLIARPAEDQAEVTADRLPPLSGGFEYRLWVGMTARARSALPGDNGNGGAGHVHGALTAAAGGHEGHEATPDSGQSAAGAAALTAIDVGPLTPPAQATGPWTLRFSGQQLDGRSLEVLRTAAIVLTATSFAAGGHHSAEFSAATIVSGTAGSVGGIWDPIAPAEPSSHQHGDDPDASSTADASPVHNHGGDAGAASDAGADASGFADAARVDTGSGGHSGH